MKHSKKIFFFAVALMLSAGLVVGWVSARSLQTPKAAPEHSGPWFDELNLTPDQHQKMDAIWADVPQKISQSFDARRAADKNRDLAIRNLLTTPAQKAAYDKIMDDYTAQRAELDKQRQQVIHDAEDKCRALLDDEQKKKWDSMPRGSHEGHGMHHPSSQHSTTMPSGRWGGGQ